MSSEPNSSPKRIGLSFVGTAVLIMLSGIVGCDPGHTSLMNGELHPDEITGYLIDCATNGPQTIISTDTFRVNVEKQEVIRFSQARPQFNFQSKVERLTECAVWSKNDWICNSLKGHDKLGFSDGIARSRAVFGSVFLGVSESDWENASKNSAYVSKLCLNNAGFIRSIFFDAHSGKSNPD